MLLVHLVVSTRKSKQLLVVVFLGVGDARCIEQDIALRPLNGAGKKLFYVLARPASERLDLMV